MDEIKISCIKCGWFIVDYPDREKGERGYTFSDSGPECDECYFKSTEEVPRGTTKSARH